MLCGYSDEYFGIIVQRSERFLIKRAVGWSEADDEARVLGPIVQIDLETGYKG